LEQAELSAQTAHSVVVGKHALLSFLVQKEQNEENELVGFDSELVF
jgi:hypothetical protein